MLLRQIPSCPPLNRTVPKFNVQRLLGIKKFFVRSTLQAACQRHRLGNRRVCQAVVFMLCL